MGGNITRNLYRNERLGRNSNQMNSLGSRHQRSVNIQSLAVKFSHLMGLLSSFVIGYLGRSYFLLSDTQEGSYQEQAVMVCIVISIMFGIAMVRTKGKVVREFQIVKFWTKTALYATFCVFLFDIAAKIIESVSRQQSDSPYTFGTVVRSSLYAIIWVGLVAIGCRTFHRYKTKINQRECKHDNKNNSSLLISEKVIIWRTVLITVMLLVAQMAMSTSSHIKGLRIESKIQDIASGQPSGQSDSPDQNTVAVEHKNQLSKSEHYEPTSLKVIFNLILLMAVFIIVCLENKSLLHLFLLKKKSMRPDGVRQERNPLKKQNHFKTLIQHLSLVFGLWIVAFWKIPESADSFGDFYSGNTLIQMLLIAFMSVALVYAILTWTSKFKSRYSGSPIFFKVGCFIGCASIYTCFWLCVPNLLWALNILSDISQPQFVGVSNKISLLVVQSLLIFEYLRGSFEEKHQESKQWSIWIVHTDFCILTIFLFHFVIPQSMIKSSGSFTHLQRIKALEQDFCPNLFLFLILGIVILTLELTGSKPEKVQGSQKSRRSQTKEKEEEQESVLISDSIQ